MAGLHDLRYKANILHRDISENNVMYEMHGDEVYFILIDFDLATFVDDKGIPLAKPSSNHRTGTLPFMAWELVQDVHVHQASGDPRRHQHVIHRLRHDYESLFWLALYCALLTRQLGSEEKSQVFEKIVQEWEIGGKLLKIASLKKDICTDSQSFRAAVHFPKSSLFLRPMFLAWCKLFRKARDVHLDYFELQEEAGNEAELAQFDLETMNGILTCSNIQRALKKVKATPGA